MSLYLTAATFLDPAQEKPAQGTLQVTEGHDGLVEMVSGPPSSPAPDDTILDCSGHLVVPAFGCGHHHAYSALARGMRGPSRTPSSFSEILELVWWPLDRALDHEMLEACALVTALECARSGVTFVIDHHSSPNAVRGALSILATAFEKVGVRLLPCVELSDRDGVASREAGLGETEDYLASGRPALVGLHASFTVGEELLQRAVDLARRFETGVHLHMAEDQVDQEITLRGHGVRVVERLKGAGALDLHGTIMAHCLHLDAHERGLIADSPAWVVQNSESNLNNAVGTFDARGLGERIMLGTDGLHSDMIRSARAAYLVGQGVDRPSPVAIHERLRAVHRYAAEVGLEASNDLVVLEYDPPTPLTVENWPGHLAFGLSSRHVRHVVSSGRLIVRDRRSTQVDETDVSSLARRQAARLWSRLSS